MQTFSVSVALSNGWRLFTSRYGTLLGATLLLTVVSVGVAIAEAALNGMFGYDRSDYTVVSMLVQVFFAGPFSVGILLFALLHLRGEPADMATLFAPFKRYWPIVGICVLLNLIFGGVALVAAFLVGVSFVFTGALETTTVAFTGASMIAVLGAICVVLFLLTRLLFTSLLCIDPRRRLGVTAAFATSWRRTGPVFWPLLGLNIIMGLIVVASVVLLPCHSSSLACPSWWRSLQLPTNSPLGTPDRRAQQHQARHHHPLPRLPELRGPLSYPT